MSHRAMSHRAMYHRAMSHWAMTHWTRPLVVLSIGALTMAWGLLWPAPLGAHPHAWIYLKTVVLFDDDGRVAGLRQRWLFDEFYTLYATEEFDKDGDGRPDDDQLWQLAVVNLESLAEYDYFTYLQVDGVQPAYEEVSEYETYMDGENLVLVFTVKLLSPADPRQHAVTYSVYDPTYYIEVAHAGGSDDPISFEGAAPGTCTHKLNYPDPDEEILFFASSLDQTQSAGDGLGAYFAEEVAILCE